LPAAARRLGRLDSTTLHSPTSGPTTALLRHLREGKDDPPAGRQARYISAHSVRRGTLQVKARRPFQQEFTTPKRGGLGPVV
jgi:hypothetical protein